jgi:hypothetical protein
MSEKHDLKIDELLNSFIDGELTKRQQIKVQRLIAHDPKIVQRLRELENIRALISSMPTAEAPADMPERVKAALQSRVILTEPAYQSERFDRYKGAQHLLFRKLLTAAAMVGLMAILGTVVYTIISPEKGGPTGFTGTLEVTTSALSEVDEFIADSVANNNLLQCSGPRTRQGKRVYVLTGSRVGMNLLLNDLDNVWTKFDSAMLVVDTKTVGQKVVNASSAQDVTDLITPVKPRITSKEEPSEKRPIQTQDSEKLRLTIVITGSE